MDMDNHPIPQDVSHFQFKLIGEMTLKQFGYLGAGMVMAWLFFSLPINFFVRIPLALIYAGSGIVLAFIPIEGRPADTMIKNFAKALFAPNQYIFHKESADAVLSNLLENVSAPPPAVTQPVQTTPQEPLNQPGMDLYVPSSTPAPVNQPEAMYTPPPREFVQLQRAPSAQPAPAEEKPKTVVTPQPIQLPTPAQPEQPEETPAEKPSGSTEQEVTKQQQNLSQQASSLTQALEQAKSEEQEQQGSPGYEQAHQKVIELENKLQQFAQQKQQLEQELLVLKQKLANQTVGQVYTPSVATAPQPTPSPQVPQESQHVRQISKQMGASMGMPHVPDVPNLITGIVKDSRNNVLPNILIEVKDNEGNPVRAFKTNQLGQFASATPLLNGTYTIFFEDPSGKHRFDTIEITANGDILLPIEVISIDQREELRKELFG